MLAANPPSVFPAITDARRARVVHLAGLYAVTPDERDTALLCSKVAAALAGGASVVQYRNKSAAAELRAEQARALAALCRAKGVLFIVNDDARLACAVDADGVHVGEDDGDLAAARAVVGRDRLVGISCYGELARARIAVDAGADYVAFGSFFVSSTKPGARRAELPLLEQARSLGVPVVAIGGITAGNARELFDAGADAVAVIADVFGRDDPADIRRAAEAIVVLFDRFITARKQERSQ